MTTRAAARRPAETTTRRPRRAATGLTGTRSSATSGHTSTEREPHRRRRPDGLRITRLAAGSRRRPALGRTRPRRAVGRADTPRLRPSPVEWCESPGRSSVLRDRPAWTRHRSTDRGRRADAYRGLARLGVNAIEAHTPRNAKTVDGRRGDVS